MLFYCYLLTEKSLKAGVIKSSQLVAIYYSKTIILVHLEFKLGLLRFVKNKLSNRYPLRAEHKIIDWFYKQAFFYDCEFSILFFDKQEFCLVTISEIDIVFHNKAPFYSCT
jgi:hypothetical protein